MAKYIAGGWSDGIVVSKKPDKYDYREIVNPKFGIKVKQQFGRTTYQPFSYYMLDKIEARIDQTYPDKFETRAEAIKFINRRKREGNHTVTSASLPVGEWAPAHAIRQNADGSVDILREKNSGRRANISEGFMAGGVFHPIRHAGDYDASRVGEGRAYKKKRKKGTRPTSTGRKYTPKKASTKRAMPISRREYGGDGSRYRNPGTLPTSKKNDVEYVTPDGAKTFSAAKAKRVAKKMATDLGRNVQIHWRRYSTDKYGSYTVKP